MLPPDASGAEVRTAIRSAHPRLAPVFETGLGLRLMFTESRILVASLLALEKQGVVALPSTTPHGAAIPSRPCGERDARRG
jgi:hypothetical protein